MRCGVGSSAGRAVAIRPGRTTTWPASSAGKRTRQCQLSPSVAAGASGPTCLKRLGSSLARSRVAPVGQSRVEPSSFTWSAPEGQGARKGAGEPEKRAGRRAATRGRGGVWLRGASRRCCPIAGARPEGRPPSGEHADWKHTASFQPFLKFASGNWYSKLFQSHVTGKQRLSRPLAQPNLSPAEVAYWGFRQLGAAYSAIWGGRGGPGGGAGGGPFLAGVSRVSGGRSGRRARANHQIRVATGPPPGPPSQRAAPDFIGPPAGARRPDWSGVPKRGSESPLPSIHTSICTIAHAPS
jgi:hypothetical protein